MSLESTIEDALDTLVNQFADPMAFFRELIQNSIDAGSPEIDIWLSHDDAGLLTVQVQDYGEGMDRNIIDSKLTRLFSSSKDGDFTKIGRFGIGFVSVFAIRPEAVCVDTARGGETWRVLFKQDRTFERLRLDTPVEGTLVRLFKHMSATEYQTFAERARTVVTYWCKHAAAEIRFMDTPVNQPFDLPGEPKVTYSEQGTRVVAAFCDDAQGTYGFYNRGLTLHEGPAPGSRAEHRRVFFPHVAFKIDSRYLEHTLTRDNVLRDSHFDKAMAIVETLVREELPRHLIERLGDFTHAREQRDAQLTLLARYAEAERKREMITGLPSVLKPHRRAPVFRSVSGDAVTLQQVLDAAEDDALYVESTPSPVGALLQQRGEVVLHVSPAGREALDTLVGKHAARVTHQSWCTATAPTAPEHHAWGPLQACLTRLLDRYGAKVREVCLGHLGYPGSAVHARVVITQERFGELTALDDAAELATSFFGKRRAVVVNADHPTVPKLIALAATEPEVAAYLTAKLFFLHDELTPQIDSTLATLTVEQRCLRSKT